MVHHCELLNMFYKKKIASVTKKLGSRKEPVKFQMITYILIKQIQTHAPDIYR